MADTFGDLIDKLTIANIRLWHLEDERRLYCATTDNKTQEIDVLLKKVSLTNRERNDLIDQINAGIAVLVDSKEGKNSTMVLTAEVLLGHGKNKFYKQEDC